jgi:flagellar biosynthesis protein FlhG
MRDQAQDLRELAEKRSVMDGVLKPVPFSHPPFQHGNIKNNLSVLKTDLDIDKPKTRVIAVTSGKGGVGKTSLSLNLSVILSLEGKKVLIIDGDMGLANVAIMAGVIVKKNIAHYITGKSSLKEIIIQGPGNIDILPGASGIQELADLPVDIQEKIMTELNILACNYDVLIIDTGAGLNSSVMAFASIADDIIVVTLPEDIAITDAYSSIKTFYRKKVKGNIHLIINRASTEREAQEVIKRINIVTSNFLSLKMKTNGFILEDTDMRDCSMSQKLLAIERPHSRSMICLTDFKKNLFEGLIIKRGKANRIFNEMLNILRI